MDHLLGLLRVRVLKGVNLDVRDVRNSDPYVIIRMGEQKLKTRAVNKNVNPEWNEDLTLSVDNPSTPVRVEVYDKDIFSADDPMGNAEFDIQPFVEALKMNLDGIPNGTVIRKLSPSRQNCLAEESPIFVSEGKVMQHMALRLRDVESGEVELRLEWVTIPGAMGL